MNMEINPSEYKILIVDDVMSNVLLLKVLLTNEKFAIATANNGLPVQFMFGQRNVRFPLSRVIVRQWFEYQF